MDVDHFPGPTSVNQSSTVYYKRMPPFLQLFNRVYRRVSTW